MDRKLSINPAIKKQHQLIQAERCLSSSTSIDTPSDMSSSSSNHIGRFILLQFLIIDHTNDLNSFANARVLPILSMSIPSQSNGTALHHYYNTTSQPLFHFGIPSQPVYCTSGPSPVWHHYFSTTNNYPVCFHRH
jgi:hypothetical protein